MKNARTKVAARGPTRGKRAIFDKVPKLTALEALLLIQPSRLCLRRSCALPFRLLALVTVARHLCCITIGLRNGDISLKPMHGRQKVGLLTLLW